MVRLPGLPIRFEENSSLVEAEELPVKIVVSQEHNLAGTP